jgi:hypothetical protein
VEATVERIQRIRSDATAKAAAATLAFSGERHTPLSPHHRIHSGRLRGFQAELDGYGAIAECTSTDVLVARTTASASTVAFKEQIHAAVAGAAELPAGPVRLELAFVVGPRRNWINLWKQTIDSLDPLLGRTQPDRDWHPLDGRITQLGMHRTVDPTASNEVAIGIAAQAL